jgi:peptide/nickel transport system substrate-binding protein
MTSETSRRDLLKLTPSGIAAAALVSAAPGRPAAAAPVPGGRVVAAMSAATETVDPHFSRSQAARNVLMHMYETLVSIDEHSKPQLQLAEVLEVGDDFRRYRFTLRQGVPFHNGKEMTSNDVKASLERFARQPGEGAWPPSRRSQRQAGPPCRHLPEHRTECRPGRCRR